MRAHVILTPHLSLIGSNQSLPSKKEDLTRTESMCSYRRGANNAQLEGMIHSRPPSQPSYHPKEAHTLPILLQTLLPTLLEDGAWFSLSTMGARDQAQVARRGGKRLTCRTIFPAQFFFPVRQFEFF